MAAPFRNLDPSQTQYELVIDWLPLSAPDNGDSDVTSYHLRWYHLEEWKDLYGIGPDATLVEFIVTSGIARGATYKF